MIVREREVFISPAIERNLISHFESAVAAALPPYAVPVRFAVTSSTTEGFRCELATVEDIDKQSTRPFKSLFSFQKRSTERTEIFTAVLLVPTGIGAEVGGHAGDATPVAKLFASICDRVITHPNVVNASDINEIPDNALYVEGSVVTRLLMGTVGLQPTRANRVLIILDSHETAGFVSDAVNAVSAARASYGLSCPRVVVLDPPMKMKTSYTSAGTASGEVSGLERICRVLDAYREEYDAVALASVIEVPSSFHLEYFQSKGGMVNPWGGVEAMLTHSISSLYDVPSAHSPMFESEDIAELDAGVVDPRMAAEAVSLTFLQCTLKGLQKSPRLVTEAAAQQAAISVADISCLVIPEGCLGLPTLAAFEQGIPVIAVRENRNLMKNDLARLPWGHEKYFLVENYWEAAGVAAALKAGIAPSSVRRPLQGTKVSNVILGDDYGNPNQLELSTEAIPQAEAAVAFRDK